MIAPNVVSRNRFQVLLCMWHFARDENAESTDGNKKISSLSELLVVTEIFCSQDSVVDESMMPFRGRLKFHRYMPGKAHKYDIFSRSRFAVQMTTLDYNLFWQRRNNKQRLGQPRLY